TANPQALFTVICGGAPKAPMCNDLTETQNFMLMLSVIQGSTAGFPLFTSEKDFLANIKGGGQFGPFLTKAGIKPVDTGGLDSEIQKMITVRSKVFSIYADGIVSGYKRNTRVRIHEVVDFRDSPPPTALPLLSAANALGAPGGAAASTA